MSDEFKNSLDLVAEAEKKYQESMKRVEQNHVLPDVDKFNSTLLQSLEDMESVEREQSQAPLDTAAALKQIIQMIEDDRVEREASAKRTAEQDRRQKHIERIQFWATFIATLIGSAAAVGGLIATIVLN